MCAASLESSMKDLFLRPRKSYLAVVAIDFGTTYSGFAFAFNQKGGEGGIHMNKDWGNDQGCSTPKTPTCLLLNPDGEFHSFGYEAKENYAALEDDEVERYYYFERFKMTLHGSTNLDRETTLTARNGEEMKALTIFAHSMRYLKELAVQVIRERTGDDQFNAGDIQWVLTVPAIWKPAAKQFMREAAYEAGIASKDNPEQLIIALEPEAASVYCRAKKMRDFQLESGDSGISDVFASPGSKYLVIDIGGGTLDVTAHEVVEGGNIKEIHQVTGGPFGGTKVDQEFENLLDKLFGKPLMNKFRKAFPAEWLTLMNEFEIKKRGRRAFEGTTTRLRLPRSFVTFLSKRSFSDPNTLIIRHYDPKDAKIYNSEYLCLGPEVMKQLFAPVLKGIESHLQSLLEEKSLKEAKFFFLVGGFAESVLLQDAVRKKFSVKHRVLIPNYASIAVVQGAVMYGLRPQIFESRMMSTTYSFETNHRFKEGVHPPSKRKIIEGVAWCEDCLVVVVKEGETVKVDEARHFPKYKPLRSTQTAVCFAFYTSHSTSPKFTTDPEVGPSIGEVTVSSPDTSKGTDRDIELSVYFGGAEIKATAFDKTSGNKETVVLDFLCK